MSLIPVVGGEQKTKPTQAGVRDLRGLGLLPDLVSFVPLVDRSGQRYSKLILIDCLSMREPSIPSNNGESIDVLSCLA